MKTKIVHWIWPDDHRAAVYVDHAAALVIRWQPNGVLLEAVRQIIERSENEHQKIWFVPFLAGMGQTIQIIGRVESIVLKERDE